MCKLIQSRRNFDGNLEQILCFIVNLKTIWTILHENETMQHEVFDCDIQQFDDNKFWELRIVDDDWSSIEVLSQVFEREISQFVFMLH